MTRQEIDKEAAEALYLQFKQGAVLDGKRFDEVLDPYDYCVRIVKSWRK